MDSSTSRITKERWGAIWAGLMTVFQGLSPDAKDLWLTAIGQYSDRDVVAGVRGMVAHWEPGFGRRHPLPVDLRMEIAAARREAGTSRRDDMDDYAAGGATCPMCHGGGMIVAEKLALGRWYRTQARCWCPSGTNHRAQNQLQADRERFILAVREGRARLIDGIYRPMQERALGLAEEMDHGE